VWCYSSFITVLLLLLLSRSTNVEFCCKCSHVRSASVCMGAEVSSGLVNGSKPTDTVCEGNECVVCVFGVVVRTEGPQICHKEVLRCCLIGCCSEERNRNCSGIEEWSLRRSMPIVLRWNCPGIIYHSCTLDETGEALLYQLLQCSVLSTPVFRDEYVTRSKN
jgi:hypothetical protein